MYLLNKFTKKTKIINHNFNLDIILILIEFTYNQKII